MAEAEYDDDDDEGKKQAATTTATTTTGPSTTKEKPAVLIIGGLGYIGRFLALHIHTHQLASEVRLVDKVLPQLAWLAPEFAEACAPHRFVQADASKEQSLRRIFDRADGQQFDYVFNCGGETRYSQEDEVYRLRSLALSVAVGREAARRGVGVFVEVSTGMVYKPDAAPRKETDRTKPWLKMAQYKLSAEEELAKIPGLNLLILRLAHVYGPYDWKFVAKALCMARVYQHLEEEMKWLWTRDLRINTVHVSDCARALWTAAAWYAAGRANFAPASTPYAAAAVPCFNVVDHGHTSQGTMAGIIHDVFGIKTGFQGQLISRFARLNLESVVDDVNDESLGPWAELLAEGGVVRPGPLSPFMEKELLKDTDLSMDGGLFERTTGFQYAVEAISKVEVERMIESYQRMGWWPA